jgi:hypothetical protein
MASAGVDVATSTPEEFGTLLQSELDRWGKVVRETGATVTLRGSRMFEFLFRMFSVGEASLPAAGMGALAAQLAARLPRNSIRLRQRAEKVAPYVVTLASGEEVRAKAAVVATDQVSAAQFVPGLRQLDSRGTTGFYFSADKPPVSEPVLVAPGFAIEVLAREPQVVRDRRGRVRPQPPERQVLRPPHERAAEPRGAHRVEAADSVPQGRAQAHDDGGHRGEIPAHQPPPARGEPAESAF